MEISYNLSEIYFAALPSQSNIYGLAVLKMVNGAGKVLVASLRRPIVCVEYVNNKPFEPLIPSSKEVHFTYIPGGAEIISVDSFNRSFSNNDFIIGITFSKDKSGEPLHVHQYFNIYTDWEPISEFSLESIAQSCNSLELDFIPYKLFHTELWKGSVREITWLLSGSDHNVHLYREDKTHAYLEYPIYDYFPEFVKLPSIMLSADIVYFDEHRKRLTAMGCEDGYIRAVVTDVPTNKDVAIWEITHDSPISSVKLFTLTNNIEAPSFLQTANAGENGDFQEDASDPGISETPEFHLLVASTTEVGVIYWNILNDGLKDQKILQNSDGFDCVQCTCVADIDLDGTNEIMLGTYGQQLLIYKYTNKPQSTKQNMSPAERKSGLDFRPYEGEFSLVWQRSFAYPILAIEYLDITGDGLKELIVLTTKGLHILQHNLEDVKKLLSERLEQLVRHLNKNDTFKELQAEDITV